MACRSHQNVVFRPHSPPCSANTSFRGSFPSPSLACRQHHSPFNTEQTIDQGWRWAKYQHLLLLVAAVTTCALVPGSRSGVGRTPAYPSVPLHRSTQPSHTATRTGYCCISARACKSCIGSASVCLLPLGGSIVEYSTGWLLSTLALVLNSHCRRRLQRGPG